MGGDGIELNVVQRHYDNGCLIDGIFLDNIDSTDQAPISPSNWGIGIGVAGQSPYGIDTPDENFAKNITIRNVYANKVRQIVHFEWCVIQWLKTSTAIQTRPFRTAPA